MLSDGENEGVIRDQTHTLWLNDVEIVSLSVRCWMADEEIVYWVRTGMSKWQREGQRMRIRLYRVLKNLGISTQTPCLQIWATYHQPSLARIDFEHTLPLIARQ
jgi:hypothetical protein